MALDLRKILISPFLGCQFFAKKPLQYLWKTPEKKVKDSVMSPFLLWVLTLRQSNLTLDLSQVFCHDLVMPFFAINPWHIKFLLHAPHFYFPYFLCSYFCWLLRKVEPGKACPLQTDRQWDEDHMLRQRSGKRFTG